MGRRLPMPPTCPESQQRLLRECWKRQPGNRPSFAHLSRQLNCAAHCGAAPTAVPMPTARSTVAAAAAAGSHDYVELSQLGDSAFPTASVLRSGATLDDVHAALLGTTAGAFVVHEIGSGHQAQLLLHVQQEDGGSIATLPISFHANEHNKRYDFSLDGDHGPFFAQLHTLLTHYSLHAPLPLATADTALQLRFPDDKENSLEEAGQYLELETVEEGGAAPARHSAHLGAAPLEEFETYYLATGESDSGGPPAYDEPDFVPDASEVVGQQNYDQPLPQHSADF
eukprot:m.305635 g.305635  ORF g.305635 m.305635 type:complete len:283 (+) comp23015_c2_seq1:2-850(+)